MAIVSGIRIASWRQVHLWLALVLGAPIALASAAAVPVTYWELTDSLTAPAFYPKAAAGEERRWSELSSAALRAAPGAGLTSVYKPRSGAALHVTLEIEGEAREVSVHRQTGQVLASRDFSRSFVSRIYDLHTRLWLGEAGRPVSLGLAAALLALSLTGLVLWLPRRRWRWKILAPRLRPGREVRDLHSLVGAYTLLPVLLAAGTTVLLSWPEVHREQPSTAVSAVTKPSFLDQVEQGVRDHDPDLLLRSISKLDGGDGVRAVAQSPDGEVSELGIDRSTGEVLTAERVQDGDIRRLAISLHTGEVFGGVGRLAFAVAALAPLGLWLTGLWWWVARVDRERRRGLTLRS
jgi:uncharacterized iron-regulated membrane protein